MTKIPPKNIFRVEKILEKSESKVGSGDDPAIDEIWFPRIYPVMMAIKKI